MQLTRINLKEVMFMSITSDIIRGHTETIILAQLAHRDSYGYEINKELQRKSDSKYEMKEATMYSAFRRLEQSGMIMSYWGDENKGARRRYYSITKLGRAVLQQSREDWGEAKKIIDSMINEED
jgi:DNA-binding PadR family transcriptional regulator